MYRETCDIIQSNGHAWESNKYRGYTLVLNAILLRLIVELGHS